MKNKTLKVFESFSGYGSQRMALRNIGVDFESVGISEVDIPAILSYASIHDGLDVEDETFVYPPKEEMVKFLEDRNIGLDFKTKKVKLPKNLGKLQQLYRAVVISKCYGDVCLLNPQELPDMDLFTYSSPCQDFSVAGKQKGAIRGQTRSGLLYECEKIIEAKRPRYLLMENVKNLVGKKFKEQFDEWLEYLESLGYTNYWSVLNAKDFGVPQNRERVFCISILKEYDKNFEFSVESGCSYTLRDILDKDVDERYYTDTDRAKQLIKQLCETGQIIGDVVPCDNTICENVCIDDAVGFDGVRTYDGHVPTLRANRSGLKVFEQKRIGGMFDDEKGKHQAGSVWDVDGLAPTLDTMQGGWRQPCIINEPNYRIRKLTPLECWRLMGCSDEDFYKAKLFNSDSQLYKQAGNSIVVDVLEGIFCNLFNK